MSRPVVGVCVAVDSARYGPWNQDVAMVPAALVSAIEEHGWLALLILPDSTLAAQPEEVLRLLDGLLVSKWAAPAAEHAEPAEPAEHAHTLGEAAKARGLPVLTIDVAPNASVADYGRAVARLFARGAPLPAA